MDNRPLTEKESLDLISGMINQAKNYYYESGLSALLWGFTNVICFVLAYLKTTYSWFYFPFNPFYLMFITFLLQYYFDRREKKFKSTVTFRQEAVQYVWIAFGISVFILTIAGGFANIGMWVLPLLLLLFAIPTFITGCICSFTPMIAGGIVCWVLCILAFFVHSSIVYLIVAAGAVAAWVVPGFILRIKFLKTGTNRRYGI